MSLSAYTVCESYNIYQEVESNVLNVCFYTVMLAGE